MTISKRVWPKTEVDGVILKDPSDHIRSGSPEPEITPLDVSFDDLSEEISPLPSRPVVPERLLTPPGLISELISAIENQAIRPQPIFSLGSALVTVSALTKNRFTVGGLNTRLNISGALVGATGCGKEAYRTMPTKVANAVNETLMRADAFTSSTSLLRSLENMRCWVFTPDELGIVFSQAYADGGNSHDIGLWKEVMSIYGLADSEHSGKQFANKADNVPKIENPFLNVMGATTLSTLMEGLGYDKVLDGTMNRFLFFETTESPPKRRERAPKMELSPELRSALRFPGTLPSNPFNMAFDEAAKEFYWEKEAEFDQLTETGQFGALYNRGHEYMAKLAGIVALLMPDNIQRRANRLDPIEAMSAEDTLVQTVGVEEMLWAYELVTALTNNIIRRCTKDMDAAPFMKKCLRVLGIIAKAKDYNSPNPEAQALLDSGVMPRSILSRLAHMQKRQLDDIIETLVDMGALYEEKKIPEIGRPMNLYNVTIVGREMLDG